LKDEALDHTVWRTVFGRGSKPFEGLIYYTERPIYVLIMIVRDVLLTAGQYE
jgi:hypothetical protein